MNKTLRKKWNKKLKIMFFQQFKINLDMFLDIINLLKNLLNMKGKLVKLNRFQKLIQLMIRIKIQIINQMKF